MTRTQKILAVSIAGGACIFAWVRFYGHQKTVDSINSETTLQSTEDEAVVIDPIHRTIKIVRSNGVKTIDLPDRPSRVALLKGDGIKVTAPQYGAEIRPFGVGAYDLKGGKLGLGVDLWYYKRMDLGIGFAVNPSFAQDTAVFVGISCFIYSNTGVMLGIDNHESPLIGIKVRF